ncbi:hypothetical protein EV421DRAFT_1903662 [Armillaria borealis]|uniref:Uncharacterized protein n=1 Tax=Armillaria borealis TaxID=47425 RepID=A0AA39JI22_9AGAR|nr:hypothetical protein EV421DRAFT_1903662 [Armillaria borealis]
MHVPDLNSKLKLKLRAFLGRVKRRGPACPVSLFTLLNELLQEIAYFVSSFIFPPASYAVTRLQLCKRDQKSFHAVCPPADVVLRTTVLSAILLELTLPFSPRNQDILEYLGSQPAGYVHKLRVCICPELKPYYVYDGSVAGPVGTSTCKARSEHLRLETKANTRKFRLLYKAAFTSLINLQAFTLCITDGSGDTPPFFFEDTFECLMKLTTIDLHLTHPKFTLPFFSHPIFAISPGFLSPAITIALPPDGEDSRARTF